MGSLCKDYYLKLYCNFRFYNHDSSFVHGGLKERLPEEVHGQQQIHQKIMELDFHDCKAKILLVDSHRTLENGVVGKLTRYLDKRMHIDTMKKM